MTYMRNISCSMITKIGRYTQFAHLRTVYLMTIAVMVLSVSASSQTCANISLQDRIECASHALTKAQCEARGCCHDDQFHKCYFPADCSRILVTAGSHSAMLLLPGQESQTDQRSRFNLSMLDGEDWCDRKADVNTEDYHVKVQLHSARKIHVLANGYSKQENQHSPGGSQTRLPFYISYWSYNNQWNLIELPDDDWQGDDDLVASFVASQLRLHPQSSRLNYPCVSLSLIGCPHAGYVEKKPKPTTTGTLSTPTVVTTRYIPIFNVTAPAISFKEELEKEYYKEADGRPSAITMGTMGSSLIITLLLTCIMLDLPTYLAHYRYASRNLNDFRRSVGTEHTSVSSTSMKSDLEHAVNRQHRQVVIPNAPLAQVDSQGSAEDRGAAEACSNGQASPIDSEI